MSGDFEVEVRTWLRPPTYRRFYEAAQERQTTVAQLLSALADRAVAPKRARKAPVRLGPEELYRLVKMHSQRLNDSEIARELGCTSQTVANHRTRLRLPSNNPRKASA